jgi:multiple sugar transport system substrate-binding protein
MRIRRAAGAAVALAMATAVAAAGCSSSSGGSSAGSSAGSATGKVTIGYWGWVPDMANAVADWNKANPDIQVQFTQVASAAATAKFQTSVKAGTAPCLGQVQYSDLTTYVEDGLLQDVTSEAKQYESDYLPWTWQQVSPGGSTYGMPQDIGPVVLFYRADLFKKYGITPPQTWAEYATDAAKVHKADPSVYLGAISADDTAMFEAYAWQNQAQWFTTKTNTWVVGINGSQTQSVAQYWQTLVNNKTVLATDRWVPTFYQDLSKGTLLSYVGGAWNSSLIPENVTGGTGQWRVAPMPQWNPSDPASANDGGSSVAVLKGCQDVAAALKFTSWLDTSQQSMNVLASPTGGGLYPASTAAESYPVVTTPIAYFGDQNISQEFRQSAAKVNTGWDFGPVNTQLIQGLTGAINAATTGGTSLPSSLAGLQSQAIAGIKANGISAEAG